jgi:Uma2 family endonuclease
VIENLLDYYRREYPEFVTYDSWYTEPYIKPMYDIIDGRRTFLMPPSLRHSHVRTNIAIAFHSDAGSIDAGVGLVGILPTDIMIHKEPLFTRRPDLFVLSEAQSDLLDGLDTLPLDLRPEIVVEVLDYDQTRDEVAARMSDYLAIGIPEFWLVDIAAKTVETYRAAAGIWERVPPEGPFCVRSITLPAVTIPINNIFKDN